MAVLGMTHIGICVSDAERSHDQRMGQSAIEIQLRHKTRHVIGAISLLHQINRCPFARAGGEINRHLGWQFVPVDQHVKDLA